jgi:hypothetical protein
MAPKYEYEAGAPQVLHSVDSVPVCCLIAVEFFEDVCIIIKFRNDICLFH